MSEFAKVASAVCATDHGIGRQRKSMKGAILPFSPSVFRGLSCYRAGPWVVTFPGGVGGRSFTSRPKASGVTNQPIDGVMVQPEQSLVEVTIESRGDLQRLRSLGVDDFEAGMVDGSIIHAKVVDR